MVADSVHTTAKVMVCGLMRPFFFYCSRDSPGAEAGASAAGDEPNQREIKPRFWGADTPDAADA